MGRLGGSRFLAVIEPAGRKVAAAMATLEGGTRGFAVPPDAQRGPRIDQERRGR
jgi:hypothetical protein